jgi:hypothetical protein
MSIIEVQHHMIIRRRAGKIFEYVADMRLDKYWRDEINDTTLDTDLPTLGSIATEDSKLSKRVPHHIAKLKCIIWQEGRQVVFETLPESTFYLKSVRELENLPDTTTRLTYMIAFDSSVVKHGLGFGLPAFFLKFYTKLKMTQYMKKLKNILESQP